MKDYTQRLISRTLHEHNDMVMQKLKEDGSKKRMFNHIKRLMRLMRKKRHDYLDFKWQWNNCE